MPPIPALKNVHVITKPVTRGEHRDVYIDFENEIVRHTGWHRSISTRVTMQKIFERFFFPRLKDRSFHFDLPPGRRNTILFSVLSGWEYVTIFPYYLFKSRLKVIYQFDTWARDHAVHENAFRSFRINLAFFSIREAADHFHSLNLPHFSAYWIPEAVDGQAFRSVDHREKSIDILQYGRTWTWWHDQVVDFCRTRRIAYGYPTTPPPDTKKFFKDRHALTEALARAKIVICAPRNVTHPETGDLSTVTTRYFEGMVSKCLLLGHAPRDLIRLFGYNPVIEIDRQRPREQLAHLLDHYEEYLPLIERNHAEALARHQWKHRIAEMAQIMQSHLTGREAQALL